MALRQKLPQSIQFCDAAKQLDLTHPGSNSGYEPIQIIEQFLVSIRSGANRFVHAEISRFDATLTPIVFLKQSGRTQSHRAILHPRPGQVSNRLHTVLTMDNIFIAQPEFVRNDPRHSRPVNGNAGYKITPEFLLARHAILLPEHLIRGKRILDLGSCSAASGAWCLSKGADFYKGVELQSEFVNCAKESLGKYYHHDKWEIQQASIEGFLDSNKDSFDIILASGVMYGFQDQITALTAMAKQGDVIIIESMHPKTITNTPFISEQVKRYLIEAGEYERFIENEPFIYVGRSTMAIPGRRTMKFDGTQPSMGAIKYILSSLGFIYMDNPNALLKKNLPNHYSPFKRFGILFTKNIESKTGNLGYGFAQAIGNDSERIEVFDWELVRNYRAF